MSRETRYNTESSFPNEIDDLVFLQDADLEHISESVTHNNLAKDGYYTQAGEYLEKTATVDSWCASLFNMIKNRIRSTQQYLLNKKTGWYDEYGTNSPFIYGNEPIENQEITPVWTDYGYYDIPEKFVSESMSMENLTHDTYFDNILKMPYASGSQTVKGVTFEKKEDGSIYIHGTATEQIWFALMTNNTGCSNYMMAENAPWKLNDYVQADCWIDGSINGTIALTGGYKLLDISTNQQYIIRGSKTFNMSNSNCKFSVVQKQLTDPKDFSEQFVTFYFYVGAECVIDATIYPMLTKRTKINNVIDGHNYRFMRSGKNNVWEHKGITYTLNNDGSILINGTASAESVCEIINPYDASLRLNFVAGHTYKLSEGRNLASYHNDLFLQLVRYNSDTATYNYSINTMSRDIEFTANDNNLLSYGLRIIVASGKTVDNVLLRPTLIDLDDYDENEFEIQKLTYIKKPQIDKKNLNLISIQKPDVRGNFFDNLISITPPNSPKEWTQNGITWVNNNGTVVANGQLEAGTTYSNYWFGSRTKPLHITPGFYYLRGCPEGGNFNNGYRLSVAKIINGTISEWFSELGSGRMYKIDEESDVNIFMQVNNKDLVVDNLVFEPVFTKVETSRFDSPNLCLRPYWREWTSSNPWNTSGLSITTNPDGSITLNGTSTAQITYHFYNRSVDDFNLHLENGYYVISNFGDIAEDNFYVRLSGLKTDQTGYNFAILSNSKHLIFNINSLDGEYDEESGLIFGINALASKNFDKVNIKPMLTKVDDDWYKESMNLWNRPYDTESSRGRDFTVNGLHIITNDDGSITVNGTATADYDYLLNARHKSSNLKLESGNYQIMTLGDYSKDSSRYSYFFSGLDTNGTARSAINAVTTGQQSQSAYIDKDKWLYNEDNGLGGGIKFIKGNTYNNITIKPVLICLDDLDFLPTEFVSSNNIPQSFCYGLRPKITLETTDKYPCEHLEMKFIDVPPKNLTLRAYSDENLSGESIISNNIETTVIKKNLTNDFNKLEVEVNSTIPGSKIAIEDVFIAEGVNN